MKNDWDLIIIGSGPSGLATALAAKLNGVERVLILEKNSGVGNRLIGQSIHYKPEFLKKIFLNGIPHQAFVSEIRTFGRNYYSPSGNNTLHLEDGIQRVWIDFRIFLEELASLVIQKGVNVRTNSKVINIGTNKNNTKVVYIQDMQRKNSFKLYSDTIVIATGTGGLDNLNLHHFNLPIPRPICPIIANHFTCVSNKDEMEFFFHSSPNDGVAAISYIFPHRGNTAEYGLIIFPDVTVNPMPNVWDILDKVISYPIISEMINPLRFYNTMIATIPMGGPTSSLYANNGFIIGEAAGQVTPSGGSGILAGLEMGYFLGKELGKTFHEWGEETHKAVESKIIAHPTHQKLQLMAKIIIPYRKRLFMELGTWDRIDNEWEEITNLLSLAFGKKDE